jgi:hypothetical protein
VQGMAHWDAHIATESPHTAADDEQRIGCDGRTPFDQVGLILPGARAPMIARRGEPLGIVVPLYTESPGVRQREVRLHGAMV